jgi:DNA-binding NarL/FixJ family response regulator
VSTYEIVGFRRDFLPDVQWVDDPLRVLVCDDHSLLRRGLLVVLEEHPDLEVVGEADTGPEAAALAQQLAPDVVLVDIGLPPYGGVAAVAQISRAVPTARIVVLAANERRPDELLEAMGAGATSVILKEHSLDVSPAVVRRVARGECVLLPSVATAAKELLAGLADEITPGIDPVEITDRERLVLEVVARGADAADAATGLGVDRSTAVNLMRNLVRKLQRYWRAEDATTVLSTPRMLEEDSLADVVAAARRITFTDEE